MPTDERNMGALMVLAQGGDEPAYRLLLNEVRDWLMRYYRTRLPAGVIEDAVQQTLLVIHEKRATYDGARPFGPWLSAIARYMWIDRLRRMQKYAEGACPGEERSEAPHAALDDAADIKRLLARLKPAQAEAIRLVKLKGYSIEETAQLTGQSVPLVKVNVHRGLLRLAHYVRSLDS